MRGSPPRYPGAFGAHALVSSARRRRRLARTGRVLFLFTNHTKREPAMRNFLIVFWGIFAAFTTVATIYVLINYEVQRWKDKQRLREGIYIRRVTRFEALITILTPVFPGLAYVTEIYDTGPVNVWVEIAALLLSVLMGLFRVECG